MAKKCICFSRVSSYRQDLEYQRNEVKTEALKNYKLSEIIEVTGKESAIKLSEEQRQTLNEMKSIVEDNPTIDSIYFFAVDRLARRVSVVMSIKEWADDHNINLVFLKEPHINTDTYKQALQNNVALTGGTVDYILEGVNKYLLALAKEQIRLAFEQSEKEVEDLHQRTKEGIETARLNGKQIGQKQGAKLTTKKSVAAKEIIQKHSKDFDGTLSDVDVMKLTGLARNTYYKYKAELKEAVGG